MTIIEEADQILNIVQWIRDKAIKDYDQIALDLERIEELAHRIRRQIKDANQEV